MTMTRRQYLAGGASLAAAVPFASTASAIATTGANGSLSQAGDFAPSDVAYLDNGYTHPMPLASLRAVNAYLQKRTLAPAAQSYHLNEDGVIAKFAQLVGADPSEITYVQSTTAGEQMVLRALDLPASGGHIVTDTLHFVDSVPTYVALAKRGCDVTWLRPVNGRIDLADMRRAVRKGTRLVALSLVSAINGFQHDLKAVCDIAHRAGARVYADIIHAAGSVPIDLHASGVDFAACATYKWLMGEFGLGFLYVRKDVLPTLKRCNYGYYGLQSIDTHFLPFDPPGSSIADYSFQPNAAGAFALGTHAHAVIAALDASLSYILGLGIAAIQQHAQDLCGRLKRELPARGYMVMTPHDACTPVVACALAGAHDKLSGPMAAANVRLTMNANRFRLTPSVHNSHRDIDRFLAALPRV